MHLDHPDPNSDITLKKKILLKNDSLMVLAKYMFRLQCTVQERYPILLSLLKKNIVNNTELMPANDIITLNWIVKHQVPKIIIANIKIRLQNVQCHWITTIMSFSYQTIDVLNDISIIIYCTTGDSQVTRHEFDHYYTQVFGLLFFIYIYNIKKKHITHLSFLF